MRRLLVLLIVAGVVFWIVRDRPSVRGVIDGITKPFFGSNAVVQESEHNRVVNEAIPAITDDSDKKVTALREGMRLSEVRELFGEPTSTENVVVDGRKQTAYTYKGIHRVLYFEENRLVAIVVR